MDLEGKWKSSERRKEQKNKKYVPKRTYEYLGKGRIDVWDEMKKQVYVFSNLKNSG